MSGVAAGDVLHQNCLPSNVTLNEGLCVVGNIAGFTSSAIWLIVLFPQLYWNWYRKSVEGLSLAWAMANFLASFINCFFAFRFSLPMFSLFSAVYMPILEGLLLVQFILYGPRPLPHLTIAMFAVGLAAIIAISVLFPQLSGSLEWVAITLWSIELLPQLYLNLAQKSTQGQATGSLLLTFFGKTTDFTSAFLLNMPPQTHVLAFFSSSQAYVNIVQFLYYGKSMEVVPEPHTIQDGSEKPDSEDTLIASPTQATRTCPPLVIGACMALLLCGIMTMAGTLVFVSKHIWWSWLCIAAFPAAIVGVYGTYVLMRHYEKRKERQN